MLSTIIRQITEYIKLKTAQIRLEMMARMAKVLSHVLVFAFVVFLAFFLVFFLSLALGALINDLLQSTYLGYLIIAGGYFIFLMIMIMLARKGKIQSWIETMILNVNEDLEQDE